MKHLLEEEKKINCRPVRKSLKEYARGIAGGLLFSFPLLFTMEVWWAGFMATPMQLLLLVVVTYVLLLGYNRYAGLRADTSWRTIIIDSVEEMGIGILISFLVLLMLNRIQFHDMALEEIMGKTIIEAMVVSIGVSIGTAQLGVSSEDDESRPEEETNDASGTKWSLDMGLVVLAFCGAIIVGGNVAPTEEVVMLAVEAEAIHLLVMALASLFISVVVVFFSDFKGSVEKAPDNLVYGLIVDTCVSYVVALAASAFSLWFFGRFDGVSFDVAVAECIVLGVLASLGASAGRLLIR
ncbi:TIGR02587 family membrane protein [Pontibacter ruber]|uniref:TIGR02587 family membrane protein n=1 Tax=Pontibacter ruber TaxID=1343895 RepID=A0ABW5CZ65_9BACT|nr:TIGR02587 family membrane protein [Pontibacter ruber]